VEMARCMFHNKGLTHELWAKAMAITTYLKNRSLVVVWKE